MTFEVWGKKIFNEPEISGLTIGKAEKTANVPTTTIRNWVKTGYPMQSGKATLAT